MATPKQELGKEGESLVTQNCSCPKCKRRRTLKPLPTNFKCADIICDFCGYLAQVKTRTTTDVKKLPRIILGAAWKVQKDRMRSGIYFPLFLVQVNDYEFAIFYLPADSQRRRMFKARRPLSLTARRAGWQGFVYNFRQSDEGLFVRLI